MDKQSLKILKYISKNGSVSTNQLTLTFKRINIHTYLNFLVENQYIKGTTQPYRTQNFYTKEITEHYHVVGPYEITPKGLDYLQEEIRKKRQPLITIITSILTSIIVHIIINYILPMLPLIIE